jgi:hypothetical protein
MNYTNQTKETPFQVNYSSQRFDRAVTFLGQAVDGTLIAYMPRLLSEAIMVFNKKNHAFLYSTLPLL